MKINIVQIVFIVVVALLGYIVVIQKVELIREERQLNLYMENIRDRIEGYNKILSEHVVTIENIKEAINETKRELEYFETIISYNTNIITEFEPIFEDSSE